MPLIGELFISEILKKVVYDQKGEELGRLNDIVVVRGTTLPLLDALIVEGTGNLSEKRKQFYKVDFSSLSIFNRRIITSTLSHEELPGYDFTEDDLLAVRDVLDKQVVDINGAKVVRVNDIKLGGYQNHAMLFAIDVGIRGILRRLRIEKKGEDLLNFFKVSIPYNLIAWNYLQPISPRLKSISLTMPQQMLSKMHPADLAEIISSLSREEGANFFSNLDVESAAETLPELEPETQADIIASMDTRQIAMIIEEMSPDDAVDTLSDLHKSKIGEILDTLQKDDAENIRELLGHDEDTAGGLMTTEFLSYSPDTKVIDVIHSFKVDAKEVETIYYVYVVDDDDKLIGVISLKELLLSDSSIKLMDCMNTNIKSLKPDDDEDTVAAMISKYNLVAIPVVDDDGIMLGIVTADDIIDFILPPSARKKRKKI
ncbi:MAG: magnesium transporter [Nitrospirae bacterium]|nr:magnesium transporter [Nitrospirota bacterium]